MESTVDNYEERIKYRYIYIWLVYLYTMYLGIL